VFGLARVSDPSGPGEVGSVNGDYGAEINELLLHLRGMTVSAHANADWIKIRSLQRRLDAMSGTLLYEQRRRARLVQERDWIESDVRGFERALVLVSGSGNDAAGASATRLERRLDTTLARISEISSEIDEIGARAQQIESEIVSAQQTLVAVLRQSVDNTEEKIRAAKRARAQRRAAFLSMMASFDETPMWSPFAVMGYRVWEIRSHGLHGARHRWKTPRMDATCDIDGELPHTDGRCATVAFGCGIYAAKSSWTLMKEYVGTETSGFAVGLVGMEGKVVEHERGYRAASATALALAIPEGNTVRFIDDPAEIETAFGRPHLIHLLGTVHSPDDGTMETVRDGIHDYLENQERRRATWTSATPNG